MKLAITDLSNFDIDDQMLILCLSYFIATVKTTSTTLKQATNFEREKKKSGLAAGSHMQDSNYQTLPTMNFKINFCSSLRFTYIGMCLQFGCKNMSHLIVLNSEKISNLGHFLLKNNPKTLSSKD